jgi:hypothetical protein
MKAFRWIERNLGKLEKHGVSRQEAEFVVQGARRRYPQHNGNGKWIVVGRGQGDRFVEVVRLDDDDDDDDDDDTIFVIRAMPLISRRRRGGR